MNNFVPAPYSVISNYNGSFFPSTVHTWGNATTNYYTRLLTQRAMSIFKFTLPDTICTDYFLYNLYLSGYVSVFYHERYGVIAQWCGFEGYDLYYNPRWAIVTNEFVGNVRRLIDIDCVLVKLQPDYCGCFDLIQKYAALLGQASKTISMSYLNAAVGRIFTTKSNKDAEQVKKVYDKIFSGEPIVTVSSMDNFEWTTERPKDMLVVMDVLESMEKLMDDFDKEIGLPVANTSKRERLVADEVNKRDNEYRTRAELWLDELKKSMDKCNEMFKTDKFSVDWRYKNDSMPDNMGAVAVRADSIR